MPRSNRRLSQFAVDQVVSLLASHPEAPAKPLICKEQGNTKVVWESRGSKESAIQVFLFDELILELDFYHRVCSFVDIRAGNFYDNYGNPSRTTRERLNALLDALGDAHLLPQGVRVFLDEWGSYLGNHSSCRPLNERHSRITLIPDPCQLVFYHE